MRKFFLILNTPFMKGFLVLGLFLSLVSAPAPALAACSGPSFFFIDHWSTALPCVNDNPGIQNLREDLVSLALWAVDSILKLSAYVAVGFVIWGGIKYIKSQGDPSEMASAKNTITQAIVGLVICIASVMIVQFIQDAF